MCQKTLKKIKCKSPKDSVEQTCSWNFNIVKTCIMPAIKGTSQSYMSPASMDRFEWNLPVDATCVLIPANSAL